VTAQFEASFTIVICLQFRPQVFTNGLLNISFQVDSLHRRAAKISGRRPMEAIPPTRAKRNELSGQQQLEQLQGVGPLVQRPESCGGAQSVAGKK